MTHPGTAQKRRMIPYAGWEPPPKRRPKAELRLVERPSEPWTQVRTGPRRRGPTITIDLVEEMRRLEKEEGLTRSEIARRLDVAQSTVTKRLGPVKPAPRLPVSDVKDQLRMGHSRAEVARTFNTHRETIIRFAKRHGL